MTWTTMADSILTQSMKTFGQSVTYLPLAGGSYAISGVFDKAHTEIGLAHGAPVSSTHPVLGVRLADLPAKPAKGDRVTIGSTTYTVIDSQEDGQGGSSLRLQK